MHAEFLAMPWTQIVSLLGGKNIKIDRERGQVRFTLPIDPARGRMQWRDLVVADNGGEVNILEFVPAYDGSVPTGDVFGTVGPISMASRLAAAIDGKPIDYRDLDSKRDCVLELRDDEWVIWGYGPRAPGNPELVSLAMVDVLVDDFALQRPFQLPETPPDHDPPTEYGRARRWGWRFAMEGRPELPWTLAASEQAAREAAYLWGFFLLLTSFPGHGISVVWWESARAKKPRA